MSAWQVFFQWPSGGVYGNILASLIWAGAPLTYALVKQHRHHRKIESSLASLHGKVDRMSDTG